MKRLLFILLFPLAFLACSKNNNNNTSTSGTMSATVGSAAFQGTTTLGAYSSALNLLAVLSYSIQSKDTTAIEITMPWTPPVNKVFSSDSLYLSYTAHGTEYDANSSSGQFQLIVTSIDSMGHKIGGTFSATGHSYTNYNDSIVITNGKFTTAYTVQ